MPKKIKINPPGVIEILIAEDSPTQAEQLQYLLEQNGYHVTTAANGLLALAAMSHRKPHLVISDVVMPEMDGYALCHAIKANKDMENIPVMLVTSLSDVRDVMKGLECGADHFIRKPYDEKYLLSHIDYLLVNRRMRKNQSVQMGMEIYLSGQRHFISVERQQILDMLISIYEEAIHMNEELVVQQEKLALSNQSLNGLYLIAEGLNHASNEHEVVELAVERALDLPGIQASWIWLREGETGFRLAASRNFPESETLSNLEVNCQCRRKLLAGELDLAINIFECDRLRLNAQSSGGALSHISIPLGPKDNPLGVMNLVGLSGRLFNDDELRMVYGVGKQIEAALIRTQLHAQLEALLEQRTVALSEEIIVRELTQQSLRLTEVRLDSILSSMEDVVYSTAATPPYNQLFLNPAAEHVYGRPLSDFSSMPDLWLELIYPEDKASVLDSLQTMFVSGFAEIEYRIVRPDGELRWLYDRTHLVYDDAGLPLRIDGIVQDITERKLQGERILRLNRVYAVLSGINMSIVHIQDKKNLLDSACNIATDAGGFKLAWIGMVDQEKSTITPVAYSGNNNGYLDYLMNISLDGNSPLEGGPTLKAFREKRIVVCNNIAADPVMALLRDEALSRGFQAMAVFPIKVTGQMIGMFALYAHEVGFFDEDELKLLSEMVGDIGYALENIEKGHQLSYLASHDGLTGLPNRSLLQDRMSQAIAHADRNDQMLAILFIDLDRFKNINDSLGHNIGDTVLKAAGERLIDCVREVDTIARLGGDEFVVMLTGIDRREDITVVANKALEAIAKPFTIDSYELFFTASIGISIYPKDGEDEQALLKNADTAMYRAKEGGKNRFEFYTDVMNAASMRRLLLESQLQQALERKEFVLHYQPQADLQTGQIVGVEVLVRWLHPTMGLIPPNEFIPISEETGLILPIGEWILETACRQAMDWQATGLPPLRIAVNLSARQFSKQDLGVTVMKILEKTGLDPALLELELTESIFMQGTEEVITILKELRKVGVRLSVDDFGTGYSSLSYLRRFPVTAVKIDQSFVSGITTDSDAAGLVRCIISMAHELRLNVIAEGVETEGQLAFLTQYMCDEVQGYYLSRPLPANECAMLLRQFTGLPHRQVAVKTTERILLILSDDHDISASLKHLLHSEGYRILIATNGSLGLDLLAMHQIGVIISDQYMPEMTGVDFLHRIKGLYPDTVRILLSDYMDLKSIADTIKKGTIYKFLTKPWKDEHLRVNVREAFHVYELKYENTYLKREVERVNNELSKINS